MKIAKFFKIFFIVLFIFLIIVYFSIPIITKNYLPNYITSNTDINTIKIKRVYYKNFNEIHIDNVKLKFEKNGLDLNLVIPKNIIKLKLNKKLPSVKLIHPIIIGKINITEYKDKMQQKKNKRKNNYNVNNLKPLLENLYIEKGYFRLESIKIKKTEIKNLKGNFIFENNSLYFNNINTTIFDGKISGDTHITFGKNTKHDSKFKIENVNSEPIVNLFKKDQYKLTGKYTGKISFSGIGTKISQLSGDLTSSNKGGKINIEGKEIENFLKGKSDNLKLAIKHLENFAYDNGIIKIKSLDNKLLVRLIFESKQGTKDIEFVLHNIFN